MASGRPDPAAASQAGGPPAVHPSWGVTPPASSGREPRLNDCIQRPRNHAADPELKFDTSDSKFQSRRPQGDLDRALTARVSPGAPPWFESSIGPPALDLQTEAHYQAIHSLCLGTSMSTLFGLLERPDRVARCIAAPTRYGCRRQGRNARGRDMKARLAALKAKSASVADTERKAA